MIPDLTFEHWALIAYACVGTLIVWSGMKYGRPSGGQWHPVVLIIAFILWPLVLVMGVMNGKKGR